MGGRNASERGVAIVGMRREMISLKLHYRLQLAEQGFVHQHVANFSLGPD